jgi:anti-sigma regulatory factor (Ser/Thr protein kinase)
MSRGDELYARRGRQVSATVEAVLIRVPADLGSLGDGRAAVRSALLLQGWRTEAAELVVLCASEAITNAIEHASVPGAAVEIEIAARPDGARLRVRDRGRPGSVTPACAPEPPPSTSARGRGLLIMSALADRMELRPAGAGTDVCLEFMLEAGRLAA